MRLRTKLMKSLLFTTMILLFSTTLFGCEKTTNVNVNVKEKAEEMTKMETETMNDIQFMMEKYGLSEEEMQGLDAAKLISDFQLRSRDYTPEDIREILAAEGDMYILDEEARLSRIFSAEGGKLEEGRTDIVRTALYLNAGTRVQRYLLDLEEGIAYVDDVPVRPLSEAQVEEVKQLPAKWNIPAWDTHTEGPEDPSTGNYSWKLIFELSDGTYAVYDGYTRDMTHLPDHFAEVRDTLVSLTANDNS